MGLRSPVVLFRESLPGDESDKPPEAGTLGKTGTTARHRSMSAPEIEPLKAAIQRRWTGDPSTKARRYIGTFFNATRTGTKLTAQVEGNYGTYTVSLQLGKQDLASACSCYIGKQGFCHHCEALAFTFLRKEAFFKLTEPVHLEDIEDVKDVKAFLEGTTLESLLQQLAAQGITRKALAEGIGMNSRHLSAIKSSELRNRYFNELGVTKLACLWVLEHVKKIKTP